MSKSAGILAFGGDYMSIRVLDGILWQWDGNRKVQLDGKDAEASEVHFAKHGSRENAMTVEVQDIEGMKVADIPNILLQDPRTILVWTWKSEKTLEGNKFTVRERNRPSDYVYFPTKVVGMETLKEWVYELLQDLKLEYNYEKLANKPMIEGVILSGDKSFADLGLKDVESDYIHELFS